MNAGKWLNILAIVVAAGTVAISYHNRGLSRAYLDESRHLARQSIDLAVQAAAESARCGRP